MTGHLGTMSVVEVTAAIPSGTKGARQVAVVNEGGMLTGMGWAADGTRWVAGEMTGGALRILIGGGKERQGIQDMEEIDLKGEPEAMTLMGQKTGMEITSRLFRW
eukprot:TRINITY_DN4180_c0_g3_i1.p3 TRINITY_DN4180_c0_g3~~TRINITY_DN4180_c0_g3_i1.p3  ORF type:complete len:116 (+),score=23.61 TRINITY_DN4180_c0_g3_i1:36-350(+)